jgi:hypothetical protein
LRHAISNEPFCLLPWSQVTGREERVKMLFQLFLASLLLAFALSAAVAWAFKSSVENILHRFLAGRIAHAVTKYLLFAIVVAGISDGTHAGALRDYINDPSSGEAIAAQITSQFWTVQLYRTAIGALEGIIWLLLLFSLLASLAIMLIRKADLKDLLPHEE